MPIAPDLKALATPRYLERARLLGAHAARRLSAVGVDARRHAAAADGRSRDNGALALVIPASHAGSDGERPAGRLAQLARITGRSLELVAGEG